MAQQRWGRARLQAQIALRQRDREQNAKALLTAVHTLRAVALAQLLTTGRGRPSTTPTGGGSPRLRIGSRVAAALLKIGSRVAGVRSRL